MTPIQETALIKLGLEPMFMGWYLARRLGKLNCTWAYLAASLGLTIDQLVSLAWCKAPRDECIQVVANYIGIPEHILRDLVREGPLNPVISK